jgi:tyrosinase
MGQVSCSARDPIFYLHHANIDRLWQVWLNLGLGRANPLGADSWKNQIFTFFDENGQQVVLTGCQVVDMAGQLGYTYDGVPVNNVQRCEEPILTPADVTAERETLAVSEPAEINLGLEPVSVDVPLSEAADERILDTAISGTGRILLIVEDVSLLNPGAAYSIYINLPPWRLPDPNGPHFAGNLAIFGDPDHPHEQSRGFDITDRVRALSGEGLWTKPFNATFVRIDPEEEGDPETFLRIGVVSIAEQ